jgi:hypothetical protein
MNKLWRIPLLGEGACIEAFPGYFERLAAAHGIRTTQLDRALTDWFSNDRRMESLNAIRKGMGSDLSYRRRFFDELVQVNQTEWATGMAGLHKSSVAGIRLSGRNVAITKVSPSWCPYCLRDDLRCGTDPYLRLVWCIQYVERCHLHDVKLLAECPSCGRAISRHWFRGEGLHCVCRHDLAMIDAVHCAEPGYGEKDGIMLVEMISRGDFSYSGIDAIGSFISLLEDKPVWTEAMMAGKHWLTSIAMHRSTRRLSYRSLLRLSYLTGVSVADIFSNPSSAADVAGQMFVDAALIKSDHPRSSDLVDANFGRDLEACSKSSEPLEMSFAEYCQARGVSVSLAKYRYPAASAMYRARHRGQSRERLALRMQVARSACEELRSLWGDERFFVDLHRTAAKVASMSGLPSKFVMQPIELMAVLYSSEHETFGSLVKRLPLPDEQIHVILIVCIALVEKPAVHVFPADLVAPLDELSGASEWQFINLSKFVVALRDAYRLLHPGGSEVRIRNARRGSWRALQSAYGRFARIERGCDRAAASAAAEYWSALREDGVQCARLRLFISLGIPSRAVFFDIIRTGLLYSNPDRIVFRRSNGCGTWEIPVPDMDVAREALNLGPPSVQFETYWRGERSNHLRILARSRSLAAAIAGDGGKDLYDFFRSLVKALTNRAMKKDRMLRRACLPLCMERMQRAGNEAIRLAISEALGSWNLLLNDH